MEVYRLILETEPGRVDTGATYEGCSQNNKDACQPVQFANVQDAINFARQRGEIPVHVPNAQVAWDIIEGRHSISENMIISEQGSGFFGIGDNPFMMAALAIGAVVILPKLLGKRG